MYSSKCSNFNYMEFVGYETCDRSIWTSCEGFRNTNITSKQGINKSNTNNTSTS